MLGVGHEAMSEGHTEDRYLQSISPIRKASRNMVKFDEGPPLFGLSPGQTHHVDVVGMCGRAD